MKEIDLTVNTEQERARPNIEISVYRPQNFITNEEIESWGITLLSGKKLNAYGISNLTGVEKRFIANDMESPFFMGLEAASSATAGKNMADVVIVSTSFPTGEDMARKINHELGLGAPKGELINIHAACSGFAVGLSYLHKRRKELDGARILMVNTEKYSPYIQDLREEGALQIDPWLCHTIFSDQAAAMSFVLGEGIDILGVKNKTNFSDEENAYIGMPIDYSLLDDGGAHIVKEVPPTRTGKIYQDGPHVFKTMISNIPDLLEGLLYENGISYSKVDHILTHQGTKRMTDGISDRLPKDLPEISRDQEDGNSSSVAIPRLIKRNLDNGNIKKDDIGVVVGFGGGLMASSALVKFG